MSHNNIVFWSGGQDSTLIAIQLLRAGKYITLLSLDNSQIGGPRQQNLEQISRKSALEKMQKEFGKERITHKTVAFDFEFSDGTVQPQIFCGLFPLLCQDGDIAYYGAIKTDTFWHIIDKLRPAFDAMCKLRGIKVELKFPLEWYHKKQVKAELKKYGYLEYTIHSGNSL